MPPRRRLSHGAGRSTAIAVAALTALAAVLRFSTLDVQSLWLDEAITIDVLREGALGIVPRVRDDEVTPPLYYLVAWVWTRPFGTGEVGLRALSALLGTATVPVAYGAAATLVSRRAGVILAALVAVNPFLLWYSQEARAYPLLLLLGAASLLTFARALKDPRPRTLALWCVTSALALATHYFALFLVVVEAVWLLVAIRRRHTYTVVGVVGLAGVALLPLALPHAHTMLDASTSSEAVEPPLWRHLGDVARKFLVGESPGIGPVGHHAWLAGLLALTGVVFAATLTDRRERRGAALAAAVGVLAVGIPVVTALAGYDVIRTRNLIAMWVPFLLVVAAGFGARRTRIAGPVAAAALFALFSATSIKHVVDDRAQRDDWRRLAQLVRPVAAPEAVVVTPKWNQLPLALYVPDLRPMPAAGRRVRQIAVVDELASAVHRPQVPILSRESRVVGRLRVVRFRLRHPSHMTPDELRALVSEESEILLSA